MGLILAQIRNQKKKLEKSELFSLTISHLKDYWIQYKVVCDTLWMDFEEFHKIFKESEQIFSLWDYQENALIDALELFSCLILTSKSNFEEKLKFIFEIYDFNDLHSLSRIDLEYIINCCLTSITRIHKCAKEVEIDQNLINLLIVENLKSFDRVNISQFLDIFLQNQLVLEFMHVIDQETPVKNELSSIKKIELLDHQSHMIPDFLNEQKKIILGTAKKNNFTSIHGGIALNNNQLTLKNKYIAAFMDRIKNFAESRKHYSSKFTLNWVYGIRYKNVVRCLIHHQSVGNETSTFEESVKIIYSSYNVVILYYYLLNKQKLYNEHKNHVSSIAVSQDNLLCASGDGGNKPQIRVWEIKNLQTKVVIFGISNSEIYLLKFIKLDKYLIAVTKRHDQPLHIYDLLTGNVHTTFLIDSFLLDLSRIFNLIPKRDSIENAHIEFFSEWSIDISFFAFTNKQIHLFLYNSNHKNFIHKNLNIIDSCDSIGDEITSCLTFYMNSNNPQAAIYQNEFELDLIFFIAQKSGKLIQFSKFLNFNNEFEKKELKNFHAPIVDILFKSSRLLLVLTSFADIHFFDFVAKVVTHQIIFSELCLNLSSFEIKNMEPAHENSVFVITMNGEIVKIDLNEKLIWNNGILKSIHKADILSGVAPIPAHSKALNLLEIGEKEKYLFLATGKTQILTFSCFYHKIINNWLSPEPVTFIDSIFNKSLGIVNAIGTISGNIYIRVNWTKILEIFNCKTEIVALNFSPSGKLLFASSKSGYLFIFTRKNGLYFKVKEDSFKIPNEFVISFNFKECQESDPEFFILLETNMRNHYVINLSSKNHYQPLKFAPQTNLKKCSLKFCIDMSEDFRPIIILNDPYLVIMGNSFGFVTVYESKTNFDNKITGYYNGHSGNINSLLLSRDIGYLYTLSVKNGELFEWKIDIKSKVEQTLNKEFGNDYYQAHDSTINQVKMVLNNINSKPESFKKLNIEKKVIKNDNNNENESQKLIKCDPSESQKNLFPDIIFNNYRSNDKIKSSQKLIANSDSCIENQIQTVSNIQKKWEVDSDSFVYFRSFINSDLRKLYRHRSEISCEKKDTYKKTFSDYSIHLKYIYGISCYEFKDNCFYLHTPENVYAEIVGEVNDYTNEVKKNKGKISEMNIKEKKISQNNFNTYRFQAPMNSIVYSSQDELENESNYSVSKNDISETPKKGKIERQNEFNFQAPKLFSIHPKKKQVKAQLSLENYLSQYLKELSSNMVEFSRFNKSDFGKLIRNYGRCDREKSDCRREILYVISRIAVITNPLKIQTQRFYEGHKSEISALTLHPIYKLAASGEIAFYPKIHIWNTTSCFNVSIIQTYHEKGVLLIDFSFFGSFILSVSVEKSHSIQISDWKLNEITAFRNTSMEHIISARFHPLKISLFVTGSLECVDFWELKDRNIEHKRSVLINKDFFKGYVTTLTFITYRVQKKQKTDLLITSSHGQIGLVNNYEYVSPSNKLDTLIVNVVRLVSIGDHIYIFLGCEDGWVKGFTLSFEKVFEWKESDRFMNQKVKTRGIQSLDFYLCESGIIYVVAVSRDGKLFELELIYHAKGKSGNEFFFYERENKGNNLDFKKEEKLLFQAHSAQNQENDLSSPQNQTIEQKRVLIALNSEGEIMASVGDDEFLFIWDVNSRFMLKALALQAHATAIKFAPNNRLLIGFSNGRVKIFDLVIMTSFDLGNNFSVVVKEHPFIIYDPEVSTSVLNIELTDKGERLAISYDISRFEHEIENRKKEYGGFLVAVYQLKTKISVQINDEINPYKPFDELRPSLLNQFEMSKVLCQNMAVFHMKFSEDLIHLIVYLQKMTEPNSQNNFDQDGQYIIRNLASQSLHNASDNDNLVSIKKVNFPSHVYGVKLLTDSKNNVEGKHIVHDLNEIEEMGNNKIRLSAIADSDKISIMGSTKGEIFVARGTMFACKEKQSPIEYSLDEMVQSQTYPGHVSLVNKIEIDRNQKYVFTTGINDECIFQWEIEKAEDLLESEFSSHFPDDIDFCRDIPNREQYFDLVRIIYPLRNLITKIMTNKSAMIIPKVKLEMIKTFGRKALSKRSNILLSANNQLIYSSGTILNILDPVFEKIGFNSNMALKSEDIFNKQELHELKQKQIKTLMIEKQISEHCNNVERNSSGSFPEFLIKKQDSIVENDEIEKNSIKFKKNSNLGFQEIKKIDTLKIDTLEIYEKYHLKFDLNKQIFILPNSNKTLIPPSEISCLEIANDGRTVCIGLSDSVASLYFYDILSLSSIDSIFLENCCSPIFVRFSADLRFLICCGLDQNYLTTVYFVDIKKMCVIGVLNLKYCLPSIFRDGMFIPTKNNEFVLVGPSHVSSWKYRANLLTFKQLGITPPTVRNMTRNSEKMPKGEKVSFVFIVMKFLNAQIFISGTTDGFLFLWRNNICETRTFCYKNLPISVIALSPYGKEEFITGGFGCNLKYFKASFRGKSITVIECLFEIECDIITRMDNYMEPRFQTQSLIFVNENQIIVGFRDGSISSINLNANAITQIRAKYNNILITNNENVFTAPKKVLSFKSSNIATFLDDKVIISADFSFDSQFIYFLTDETDIFVISIKTLEIVKTLKFYRKGVDIIALSSIVFVHLETEIIAFCPQTYLILDRFYYKAKNEISLMTTDFSEKFLSIAIKNENEKKDYIEIFSIEISGLKKIFQSETQINRICLIDFSLDSEGFVFQDALDKVFFFQINDLKVEQMGDDYDHSKEWIRDGLKISSKTQILSNFFSNENKIVDIARVGSRAVIVSDDLGTVF